MKIANLHLTHLTPSDLISRSYKILTRYGLSTKKMESNLRLYLDILRRHGITPTFPITAKTLIGHPDLIQEFSADGVEFAIHGYEHIDYTKLSDEEILHDLEKSIRIFENYGISFSGFRFPYLRWDEKCINALAKYNFKWDSSFTVLWDVLESKLSSEKNLMSYQNMLGQYKYQRSCDCISLPKFQNDILEIPVSLPDDELLKDRLGIKDRKILSQIWDDILKQTYERGELFTLQLHPERITIFFEALESVIQRARTFQPSVWIASLTDIADWWLEKGNSSFHIEIKNAREFKCNVQCSERATILVKDGAVQDGGFFKNYRVMNARSFDVKSSTRPVIGVSNEASEELKEFLKNEGFLIETGIEKNEYPIFFDDFRTVFEKDKLPILDKINRNPSPLVRIWRWPNGCQSALSISGDIDGLTLLDFFSRIL